jgi:hypothetical protein
MVNLLAIGLSHGLLGLAIWRLMFRDDLDDERKAKPDSAPVTPPGRNPRLRGR